MALLEETMLFVCQMLIARHPALLAAPEEADSLHADPPLRVARHILDAGRALSDALGCYRELLSEAQGKSSGAEENLPP
jgi:hypothetical protein